jgi:hypothetical protein
MNDLHPLFEAIIAGNRKDMPAHVPVCIDTVGHAPGAGIAADSVMELLHCNA